MRTSLNPSDQQNSCSPNSDFRPISITPVLTRIIERIVIREYIYPAFLNSSPSLSFTDQFAFRPSGSVRHSSLLDKFSQLDIPDIQLAGRVLLRPHALHLIPRSDVCAAGDLGQHHPGISHRTCVVRRHCRRPPLRHPGIKHTLQVCR